MVSQRLETSRFQGSFRNKESVICGLMFCEMGAGNAVVVVMNGEMHVFRPRIDMMRAVSMGEWERDARAMVISVM